MQFDKSDTSAEFLFEEAEKLDLSPKWENDHGLFSVKIHGKKEFLFHTKLHSNSQLGAWICRNKEATHIVLGENDLPVIPYCRTNNREELLTFFTTHAPIIKKPNAGKQSVGVELITDSDRLQHLPLEGTLFEKYIHGPEYRYLIFKQQVIAVQQKEIHPLTTDPWNPYVKNIASSAWSEKLTAIAIRIAGILHLNFTAVDFIVDNKQTAWVLEINDTPSLHYFHKPHTGNSVNIARILLHDLINQKDIVVL
jgi:glutathione synthase/RimK-type ligase-like ATP-grasp enzyme